MSLFVEQGGDQVALTSNIANLAAGIYRQNGGDIKVTRTAHIMQNASQVGLQSNIANLAAGFYVQSGGVSPRLSNIRVKRPSGDWASILVATKVYVRKANGTWEIFN